MASKKVIEDESEGEDFGDIPIWDVDEDLKPYSRDRELRQMAENQYTGIIKFINDNGMFKKKRAALDTKGKLLIRRVFDDDLTDEGKAFVRLTIKPWFRSKTSAKDPSNTAILEKYLKKVRT